MDVNDATLELVASTASRCSWVLSKLGAGTTIPLVGGGLPADLGCWKAGTTLYTSYSSTQAGFFAGSIRACACQ
jgi:hypothetical protein